tara:strand:- start:4945 stop:5496 length:552 start_codon:yes stop_codon:yes gene_type:complete
MVVKKTDFKDLLICNPTVFKDDRGYFYESFNLKKFSDATGLHPNFVQDNQSRSTFGVLRGLHFQVGDMAQSKLVRVLEGEVLDVVVDMRKEEPTFGKSFSIMLTAANRTQLFIPRGFAHGFLTLSPKATFFYKCDNYYDKESERGLLYNDPVLDINWQLEEQDFILSEKDKVNPNFETLIKTL